MSLPQSFDYHYFDDPGALGYRGYWRDTWEAEPVPPWKEVAQCCMRHGVRSAIDVGCAKGYLVEELLLSGIDAEGFDISDYALSFARHLPCYQHDIRSGLRHSADAVIALGVLQYLEDLPEVRTALDAIRGAAQKWLLFSCHYAESRQVVGDPLRKITMSRAWWRNIIEAAGFTLSSCETYFDVFAVSPSAPSKGRDKLGC